MERRAWISGLAAWVALAGTGCGGGASNGKGGGGGGPTYHADVAPILAERCGSCHVEGGIAPFSLGSYEDAAPRAPSIKAAVLERRMPPWGIDGSGACGTFADSRWLSDNELSILADWSDAGAPEGAALPPPEPPRPDSLASIGATLDIGVDYLPDASRHDDYRCFLVDAGLDADRYLVAYQVRPGAPRVVHHVILYSLDDAISEAAAMALDDDEEGPGYTCFGGPGVLGSRFLAGWAPGTPATRYPAGTGLKLDHTRKLVVQIHYNLHEGPEPDRTRIDLEFGGGVTPALVVPVADLGLAVPPGVEAAPTEFTTTGFEIPVGVTVRGIFPHMHTLGRTLRVDRLPASGENSCLVDVTHWDFNWQRWFFYETAGQLEPGDRVRIRCVYDTRGRTETVRWGEGTEDEMCLAFLYVTVP